MRILFLLVLCFGLVAGLQAQYTVTKVVGKVENTTTGEFLKTGSKMSDKDKLHFSSATDLVRMIVLGKGTYVLQANPQAVEKENTVIEILKSSFHLKSKEGYLSGRAGNFESLPEALETEAGFSDKNRIASENKYHFNKEQFPVADGSRFFLQIVVPGQSPIIRPLMTNADTLLLHAVDFNLPEKEKQSEASYELGYYSKQENNSRSLLSIQPYFDLNNEMADIIQVVMKASTQTEKTKIEQECYKEVYEALGKPSDIAFIKSFNELYAKMKLKK